MQTPPANLYEFGHFQIDPAKRLLRRLDGTTVPLTPRVFDTLLYMVENHDAVLDKERIMEAVWPDSIVEENNLAQAISKLRQVFGETPGSHSYIVTVPGRGYRFVADVNKRTADAVLAVSPAAATTEATIQKSSPEARDATRPSSWQTFEVPTSKRDRLPAKTSWLWPAVVSGIAIVGLAALFFIRFRGLPAGVRAPSSSIPAGVVSSVTAPIPEKSVAVLPFDNLSDEKQNAYFAAGVQDEITSNLARIADLKVISRTSANLYKSGNPRNSREIGRQLDVAHLLEGNVQRIGNHLRVNAQLIDTRTDTHAWAQTYDRDVSDLFAIQSEIAQAIAGQLGAKISPAERRVIQRRPTIDLTAFDLYIHAKNLLLTASVSSTAKEDLLQAVGLLNQAVTRDPSFFQAYCELVLAHGRLYFYGLDHTTARLALVEAALGAASRLHPDAGETHLARARNLYWGYLDYNGALAELEIARRTLPNEADIFGLTGFIQRRQGHWEESMRSLERAIELDPRNFATLRQVAVSYDHLRRYAEEQSILDRALSIEPNHVETRVGRALIEFDWKADTRPLHQTIDSIRAANPAAIPGIADGWLICALAERDVTASSNALIALEENTFGFDVVQFNRPFIEGVIAWMTKDHHKAQAAFTAARAEQEKIVEAQPNYGPALCVLGLIDAGLGRKEEALREGRRAIELMPVEKDALGGVSVIKYLAMIAAWVGEKDLACEQLAAAVRNPSRLSYGQLKLLPFWDPLRGEPCFEQIVAPLAPK
jgi:TolB-like protein/DNA-binding winged helix-turn-helix (wHTH) protein/Tfp pilus assembly protein PilF